MTSADENLLEFVGQPHASGLLTASLRQGAPSHAYLFAGPPGSGKRAAARAFASALCCEDAGCGACPTCEKALKGTHPDISFIEPAGASVTVDQVREINRSLGLHPHESRARVFIISDAEALRAESANAFLKSLEEPPPFAYFLLLAAAKDRVLPTIVSRCQVVRFQPVPEDIVTSRLTREYGVSATMALAFARTSGGNLGLAEALVTDDELAQRRQRYLEIAAALGRGAWEGGAAELAAEIEAAAARMGEAAETALTAGGAPDGFAPEGAAKKRLQQDAHRRAGVVKRQELAQALGFMETWFRDMMAVAAGAGEAVLNKDYELELEDLALPSRLHNYRQALAVIEKARRKLGYNIDLGLCLQAMFYELMEVL